MKRPLRLLPPWLLLWPALAAAESAPALLTTPDPLTTPAPALAAEYFERLEGWGLSGVAVLGTDREVRAATGIGWADREARRPFTPETRMPWLSVSKSFTSGLTMYLIQQGELEESTRLRDLFDDVPRDKARIRLDDLMLHVSGLAAQLRHRDFDGPPEFEPVDRETLVRRAFGSELVARPVTRFVYSNLGYNLLAAALVEHQGRPLEELLDALVLQPAGIHYSGLAPLPDAERDAMGYAGGQAWGRFPDLAWPDGEVSWNLAGAGALAGPVTDLAHWVQVLRGVGFLNHDSIRHWTRPRVLEPGAGVYVYGWTLDDSGSEPVIRHEGAFEAFSIELAYYPVSDAWLILAINTDLFRAWELREPLAPVLLGLSESLPPRAPAGQAPEWLPAAGETLRFSRDTDAAWVVYRDGPVMVVTAEGTEAINPLVYPEGRPENLSDVERGVMDRARALLGGTAHRPVTDHHEARVLLEAGDWLRDLRRDAGPIDRVSNLGLVPVGEGRWFARLRFHAGERSADLGVNVGGNGRWRSLNPEPGEVRAVFRFRNGGDVAEGLLLDSLRPTATADFRSGEEYLRLSTGDFRAWARH
jgi:CubicO group peptidase (beta-lactamase class C family)